MKSQARAVISSTPAYWLTPLLIPTVYNASSPDKKSGSKNESMVVFIEVGNEKTTHLNLEFRF